MKNKIKNTKRVEAGDISQSFLCQVEKKIAELEKRRTKYLLNFWVVVRKLTEIEQKINILRNTKKIKKNKYKEKDTQKKTEIKKRTQRVPQKDTGLKVDFSPKVLLLYYYIIILLYYIII